MFGRNANAKKTVDVCLILEGTSRLSSEDVFRGLVKNLARAMHVKMAMIAERIGLDDLRGVDSDRAGSGRAASGRRGHL